MLMALKDKMFANLRFHPDGAPKPDFVLNQPRYRDARFILAGPNFGCGSSRETAVWSLREAGIRCVIAPSFGDIFHDNAYQNGLLPLKLDMAIDRASGECAAGFERLGADGRPGAVRTACGRSRSGAVRARRRPSPAAAGGAGPARRS